MTPADGRITELIDKWLTSIDLHLRYTELSDAAYARAQQWPKHDRPTRWVLEVARQKIVELKAHCETRQAMQDATFAESLELMAFLANLVGIQHIQRFIPLAEPPREDRASSTATVEAPALTRPIGAPRAAAAGEEATREMPRLKITPPAAPAPVLRSPVPAPRKEEPKAPTPTAAPARKSAAKIAAPAQPAADSSSGSSTGSSDIKVKIIADAVRLLKWGKPWHELAELIGRIADRPPVTEIRKVLRTHKSEIEASAGK
jgi:hypothetical protein